MNIEYLKLSDIKPYKNNPRINDKAVDYVAESIKEFGFRNPIIIDKDNEIIAGHTRYKAAIQLGIDEVPCLRADDLTEQQVKAYRLADNKVSEFAEWDFAALDLELEDILDIDMELFGFDLSIEEEKEVEEDDFDVDADQEPICKPGDIWKLGGHRLMCGDSTNSDDVERLMNGEKADMVFTDPPYGVEYTGGVIHGNEINIDHKRDMIKNDDVDIYEKFIPIIKNFIEDGAIYIFYATRNTIELLIPLRENDIDLHSIIIWNKINTGYADINSHYKNKYEPFVYCKRKGRKLNFVGSTKESTVWEIEKDRINDLHPTQKPIELPGRAIINSSMNGDIVLDLFGGSGSTLIACEQLDRKCYMMELDPKYCDVIIKRWETYTGKEAELIERVE